MDTTDFKSKTMDDTTQINDIYLDKQFYTTLVDHEQLIIKETEVILYDRKAVLQKLFAYHQELVESLEVRNNERTTNTIREKIDELTITNNIKVNEIKDKIMELNKHYLECINNLRFKIKEVEALTNGVKRSKILKDRVKEYCIDVRHLQMKIVLCNRFYEKLHSSENKEYLSEFNKLLKSIREEELKKGDNLEKIAMGAGGVFIIILLIVLFNIIILNSPEFTVNIKSNIPDTPSVVTNNGYNLVKVIKGLRIGSNIAGAGIFLWAIISLLRATTSYEYRRAKTLIYYSVGIFFATLLSNLIIWVFQ
jgi:hypothetical protein